MIALGSLLAFGAGCACLGIGVTVGFVFTIAGRHSEGGDGSGCFGVALCMLVFAGALYFFNLAIDVGLSVAL